MTGEVINLRQARKAKAREKAAGQAKANRAKFGIGKGERRAVQMDADRAVRTLDGAKRDPD